MSLLKKIADWLEPKKPETGKFRVNADVTETAEKLAVVARHELLAERLKEQLGEE